MQGIKPYRLDRLKSRSVISVVQGTPLTRTPFGSECSTIYADRSRSECGRLRFKLSGFQVLTRLEALHSTGEAQLSQPKLRAYFVIPHKRLGHLSS